VAEHAPARQGTRSVRVRYAVQVDVAPPRILLFTTGVLEDSYLRYLERSIRERYDLTGVPLVLEVRRRGEAGTAKRSSEPDRSRSGRGRSG